MSRARPAHLRLRVLAAVALAGFAVVLVRAVQVQAIDGSALALKAQAQQREVVVLTPTRGTITDRHGVPLAVDQPSKTIVAYPRLVRDPLMTAAFLAQHMGIRHRRARGRFARALLPALEDRRSVQVLLPGLRQLPEERARPILAAHLPGIAAVDEQRRMYPLGSLATQVLGYTDVDGNGRPDGAGLEYQLDHVLAGRPGREVVVRDSRGIPLGTESLRRAVPGRDVRLTIDRTIQAEVQRVLEDTARRWRAHSATGIVLDPRTGQILAMGTAPAYDDNRVHSLPDVFARSRNRAVQDMYEPGSTFKVVTMSAALSDGIVYPQMAFHHLPYELHVADRVIHDDAPRGPVTLTAAQILQRSSNVGTVTIAEMVGKDELYRWIRRYGFGRPTALHFPAELAGAVPAPDQWSGSSIGNIPIGQGVGVTAMQMAQMYAAIANGGVLVAPHLVERIGGKAVAPPARRRILRPRVDRQLVRMLRGVVSDVGTGYAARIPGYSVAGKTGTAQKPDGHGGYSETNYVASFVGFLPASNPRVEIMIVVDTPHGNIFGGAVAAPAFAEIGTFLTHDLSIRPDEPAARS